LAGSFDAPTTATERGSKSGVRSRAIADKDEIITFRIETERMRR
jgi:hypothetical protein